MDSHKPYVEELPSFGLVVLIISTAATLFSVPNLGARKHVERLRLLLLMLSGSAVIQGGMCQT